MDNKPNSSEQTDTINLSELFYVLLSRILTIVCVTVLCGAVAFAYSRFFIAPEYSAGCTLFVLNRNNENSLTSSDISASNALVKDYQILAGSRAVIEKVIADLNLQYDESDPGKATYTYSQLKSEIRVSVPSDSRMLVVSVLDKNPNNAKKLADAVSEVLVSQIVSKMKTEASIIDYAVVPTSPASPNVKKNTLIGAAIGFLLICGIIVLRFITDDTIKSDTDIEKYLHLPVLGTIPLDENEEPKRKRSEYRADMKKAKTLYSRKGDK
ncbi:MAG: polysaccharide export protein [Lachnospiraceae bacterium]|nr:polysaccharide export protein [Lachnospiraceae bacterium]